jgi:Predicted membrane protein (DUF2142)
VNDVGNLEMAQDASTTKPAGAKAVIVFLWAFVGVAMMILGWTYATPLGAAPDEASHILQAVAIVRGQFDEPEHPGPLGLVATVRVPGWAELLNGECYGILQDGEFGLCSVVTSANSGTTVSANTQYSNAPPLYYVIAGVPTLFLSGKPALYAIRVVGDGLNAALVALGIWLLLRFFPRRTVLVGVLIALSPMVLFLMSVVSSSGLEIASGFASWCGALCIIAHPKVPGALGIWTAIAVSFLLMIRPTSPLDVVIIAIVMAVLVGWRGLSVRLNQSLRPFVVIVSIAAAITVVMLFIDGIPHLQGLRPPHPMSLLSNMWTTLRLSGRRLAQCVGNFGWLNSPSPPWVVAVWVGSLAVLTGVAVFVSASCRRALVVLALLILAMPLLLESPQINTVNQYWQGRYWLPVVVGFPLVAATFPWPERRLRRPGALTRPIAPVLTLALGIVLMIGQVAAFELALSRNEAVNEVLKEAFLHRQSVTGVHVATTAWSPPGGNAVVTLVFVVGAIITLALAVVMTARQPEAVHVTSPERELAIVERS